MKKVLFIPHHPGLGNIKIRITEMAKHLTHLYDVHILDWNYVKGKYTIQNRACVTIKDLFKITRTYSKFGMTVAELPMLHWPAFLAKHFNAYFLNKYIKDNEIEVVISGDLQSYKVPKNRTYKYIYDLCDFPDGGLTEDILEEINNCDTFIGVSDVLTDFIKSKTGKEAITVVNGADLKHFGSIENSEIQRIKKRLGAENELLIGYIGFIGPWVNMDMACKAFELFRNKYPKSKLVWIGMGINLIEIRKKYQTENIMITGGINDHIEGYFSALDIGILPHTKSFFQDCAFHLKLIEYTAAKKPVISTPLEASVRIGLPNVTFVEEDSNKWANALIKAVDSKWDDTWNSTVAKFDWMNIANQLDLIIKGTFLK